MPKYKIHAVPKRMWYVDEYLIPSMLEQGINPEDISIYCDTKHEGNLRAWCNAALECVGDGDTWHLQDDVIISHDFASVTSWHDENVKGIICAFKSMYDGENPYGIVPVTKMWFSFPCIRIPNKMIRECSEWCVRYMIGNPVYREYWEKGVNDDYMFRRYVWDNYKGSTALNLKPNIVDHIDYLIGGTVNSNVRVSVIRSQFWEDEYLVKELEHKLNSSVD